MKQIYLDFYSLLKKIGNGNNKYYLFSDPLLLQNRKAHISGSVSFILLLLFTLQGFSQSANPEPISVPDSVGVLTSPIDPEIISPSVIHDAPAAGVPFPCDGKLYFFRNSGGKNWLSYVDQYTTSTPVVANVCQLTVTGMNAMGANPIDHYIYFTANPHTLYRLDAACTLTTICTSLPTTDIGCFDNQGRYWIVTGNSLVAYNINTCTVVKGPYTISNPPGVDIAFSVADCHFYMGDNNNVYQIDTNGVVTNNYPTGFGGSGNYGGIAIGVDGNLYGIPDVTATGSLYKYDLTAHTSSLVYTFAGGTANPCGCDMASFPCPGLTANFTATPGTACTSSPTVQFNNTSSGLVNKWIWDFGDGTQDTSTFNPAHTYASPGTYTVKLSVSVLVKCLYVAPDSTSMNVQILPSPVAAISGDTAVCYGNAATLSASGGISFLWNTGDTTNSITVTPSATTTYSVTVTAANGCTAGSTANITVHPLPTPVAAAQGNTAICEGGSVSICATGIFNSYIWSPGGGTAQCITAMNPALYSVTVTDSNGCAGVSDSVPVTVGLPPTIVITPVGSTTFCNGDSVLLTASGADSSYVWAPSGEITSSIIVKAGGTYTVTGTNKNSCMNIATIGITVNPLPTASISASGNTAICEGGSVQICSDSTFVSYSWSNGGLTTQCITAQNPTEYNVTVTAGNGCSAISNTINVTVALPPTVVINADGPTTFCTGSSVTLTASGADSSYVWSPGGTTSASIIVNTNGTYTVTGVDKTTCTANATATVTVNSLPTVSFAPFNNSVCVTDAPFILSGGLPAGGTYSGAGVSNNIFNPAAAGAGTFTLIYSYTDGNTCSNSDSTSITVDPIGTVSITPVPALCLHSPAVTLIGNPAGGTFSGPGVTGNMFDPSVAGTGNFAITYIYTGGGYCLNGAIATTIITVLNAPAVTIASSPTISCDNNTIYIGYGPQFVTLTAVSDSAISSYQWYLNGVAVPGSTAQSIEVYTAGNYNVITNIGRCSSDSANTTPYSLNVMDIRCGHDLNKVILCHVPPGNPGNPQTLCIAPEAVPAHLANHPGDCLGPCSDSPHRMAENTSVSVGSNVGDVEFDIYPNPFSAETSIEFAVPNGGNVKLELFDMKGTLVSKLFESDTEAGAHYTVKVDGSMLAEGIYIGILRTCDGVTHRKLILTK